uniref:Uncharacterized protein n=1 Tax=Plectus sambesii TaxID=2011161 RepID=A0A914WXD4_9BILA
MDLMQLGFGEQLVLLLAYCYILFKFLNTYIAIVLLVGTFTGIYLYLKNQSEYWKHHGIDGPEGNILFGHNLELRKGMGVVDTEWTKKYGKVFGTRIFGQQDLVVSDLEILRHVLAKDFSSFTNRRRQLGLKAPEDSNQLGPKLLTILEDEHWKNVRNTITPAFTTGKIKNMVPIFNDTLKIFGEVMSDYAKSGAPMDLKEICGGFAMDVIAKSAFGIDVDAQRDNSSPFIKYAKEIFSITITNPKLLVVLMFPNTVQRLEKIFKFQFLFPEGEKFFKDVLRAMIAERQQNPKKVNPDFLQLLINAISEQVEKSDVDKDIMHAEISSGKRVKLTELEMMSQSFLFLIAGYETTATTLHFALYLLALHPEIQDRVVDEINTVVGEANEISYDHIGKLTYLEQVINETLRMFVPVSRIDRSCTKDTTVNGVTIPKGCIVSVPVWVIHYDPEFYPDPQKFDPERFSPEEKASRDPLAYLPFGYGPRNCIGMRFAQLELRMALAYLVKNFKFTPCEQTEKMPIKLNLVGLTKPASPILLTVEKRNE